MNTVLAFISNYKHLPETLISGGPALIDTTAWKRSPVRPDFDASNQFTICPPALSPNIKTRFGSPPKCEIWR